MAWEYRSFGWPKYTPVPCVNCEREIVFAPFFLDGKLPNPPMWTHVHSGSELCSIWLPRKRRWPPAKPPVCLSKRYARVLV